MSAPDYTIYDFRVAEAADDSASAFRTWVSKASQVFAERWAEVANAAGSIKTKNIRNQSMDSAMVDVPVSNLCCNFNISEQPSLSIWHVSQPDAHLIVHELLGMSDTAEIADRPLTNLETVLVNTFFDSLARSFMQGWMGSHLTCAVDTITVNPKRVRLCRGKDLVISSSIQVQFDRGEVTVHWISRKQDLSLLLEQVNERRADVESGNDPRAVVEVLPIEIIGVLGETDVSMRRLANMAVGDIVKLNQRIDRPIIASVEGKPFFECWPGKIGKTIGLEVSSCVGTSELSVQTQEEGIT